MKFWLRELAFILLCVLFVTLVVDVKRLSIEIGVFRLIPSLLVSAFLFCYVPLRLGFIGIKKVYLKVKENHEETN